MTGGQHRIIRTAARRPGTPPGVSHLGALVAKGDDRIRDVPGDLTDPPTVLSALQATGPIDWAGGSAPAS